jgi:hypothetical protein
MATIMILLSHFRSSKCELGFSVLIVQSFHLAPNMFIRLYTPRSSSASSAADHATQRTGTSMGMMGRHEHQVSRDRRENEHELGHERGRAKTA